MLAHTHKPTLALLICAAASLLLEGSAQFVLPHQNPGRGGQASLRSRSERLIPRAGSQPIPSRVHAVQPSSDHGLPDYHPAGATVAAPLLTGRRQFGLGLAASGIAALSGSFGARPVEAGEDPPFIDGPDGIKFADVKVGDGDAPLEGDLLTANYGLYLAGTKEKIDYGKYFKFSVGIGEVIKGWELAVMGKDAMPPMKVGGARKVLIPPELAYGKKGAGCRGDGKCVIPPGSTLEFTIELVGIKGVMLAGTNIRTPSAMTSLLIASCACTFAAFGLFRLGRLPMKVGGELLLGH